MFEKKGKSDILCVTNRKLCREDFFTRIWKLGAAQPAGIILREKDLTEKDYGILAEKVLEICEKQGIPCILHSFWKTARRLGCPKVHLPLPVLRTLSDRERDSFHVLGVSCHCVEDAVLAQKLGCTYITAGHVFETDCKKGVPGRGLAFLEQVCSSVSIPVYAIGGITSGNIRAVRKTGARGACVMSSLMTCGDPEKYLKVFKESKNEIQ